MAKYLEITNDDLNVIVDDQYNVPMLLARYKGRTDFNNNIYAYSYGYYYAVYQWSKNVTLKTANTLEELGFDTRGGTVTAQDITNQLIVAYRVIGSTEACAASASVSFDTSIGLFKLSVSLNSDAQNVEIEAVVYTTAALRPSSETVAIFAADGTLIYDVRRGAMHFLGSLYGNIDIYQDIGGTFDFTLPAGISTSDCFITAKSMTPYFVAMKFSSSGVRDDGTIFKTVVSYPTADTLRATIRRAHYVPGTSNAWGYGGFFENLIYCAQPIGTYL